MDHITCDLARYYTPPPPSPPTTLRVRRGGSPLLITETPKTWQVTDAHYHLSTGGLMSSQLYPHEEIYP